MTGVTQTIVSKINSSGIIDSSFGTNGESVINSSRNPNSYLQKQPDGKIVLMGFHSDPGSTSTYVDIIRLLPNGQLDSSFGANGIKTIADVSSNMDLQYYGLFLQNNKIIFYGEAMDDVNFLNYRVIYRLNANGSLDTSFGNNGSIGTDGRYVFLDNQNNIISLSADTAPANGTIEKYNSNGQAISSFGSNGVLDLTFSPGPIVTACMDSSNNIIYSTRDSEIFRIAPDGTLDTTFIFNPASFPFSTWIYNITEKNGYYYIGGTNNTDNKGFISKLSQTGGVDSIFSYFVESNSNLSQINDMIINDSNIVTIGEGYIVKYLLSPSVLSIKNATKVYPDVIVFDNPIKENLVYKTKEKLDRIEIYSMTGDLVRVLNGNSRSVSDLLKGTYIVKVIFEGGKTTSKKLIKN